MASNGSSASDLLSVKDLASSDSILRRNNLTQIMTYLHQAPPPLLTPSLALRLYRALHIALYMHDSKSPLSVQRLTAQLASLVCSTAPQLSLNLAAAFWETIAREWMDIDRLRLDKLLLWVRFQLRETFRALLVFPNPNLDDECMVVEEFQTRHVEILAVFPLHPTSLNVPDGLRYHVLDIFADELELAMSGAEAEENARLVGQPNNIVREVLEPVRVLAQDGASKGVRLRAKEVVEDDRVKGCLTLREQARDSILEHADSGAKNRNEKNEDEEWEGLD